MVSSITGAPASGIQRCGHIPANATASPALVR